MFGLIAISILLISSFFVGSTIQKSILDKQKNVVLPAKITITSTPTSPPAPSSTPTRIPTKSPIRKTPATKQFTPTPISHRPTIPVDREQNKPRETQQKVRTPIYLDYKGIMVDCPQENILAVRQLLDAISKQEKDDTLTYKLCQKNKDFPYNSCKNKCDSQFDENMSACKFAYAGENAALGRNSDKYGECLDEASKITDKCMNKCLEQYMNDIQTCDFPNDAHNRLDSQIMDLCR